MPLSGIPMGTMQHLYLIILILLIFHKLNLQTCLFIVFRSHAEIRFFLLMEPMILVTWELQSFRYSIEVQTEVFMEIPLFKCE